MEKLKIILTLFFMIAITTSGWAEPPVSSSVTFSASLLESETIANTPSDKKRTLLGIGEEVRLVIKPEALGSGSWATDAGSVDTGQGLSTILTAPFSPQTAQVSVTVSGVILYKTFNAVAPQSIVPLSMADNAYSHSGGNLVGAVGLVYLQVLPSIVSFYNVSFREDIPLQSFTWPNGRNEYFGPDTVDWDVYEDNTSYDVVETGLKSKGNLEPGIGQSPVNFAFSVGFPDKYQSDSNWVPFADPSYSAQYDGSNLKARISFTETGTVWTNWMGPW